MPFSRGYPAGTEVLVAAWRRIFLRLMAVGSKYINPPTQIAKIKNTTAMMLVVVKASAVLEYDDCCGRTAAR